MSEEVRLAQSKRRRSSSSGLYCGRKNLRASSRKDPRDPDLKRISCEAISKTGLPPFPRGCPSLARLFLSWAAAVLPGAAETGRAATRAGGTGTRAGGVHLVNKSQVFGAVLAPKPVMSIGRRNIHARPLVQRSMVLT